MHSADDARVLLDAARGARRVVEIGVYEGASALTLQRALGPQRRAPPDRSVRPPSRRAAGRVGGERARNAPAGAASRASSGRARSGGALARRAVARRRRAAGRSRPDLVFIDGDHSEAGCETRLAGLERARGPGRARRLPRRARRSAGGRGLPGPTAVVARHLRGRAARGWRSSPRPTARSPRAGYRARPEDLAMGARLAPQNLSRPAKHLTLRQALWYVRDDMMSSIAMGSECPRPRWVSRGAGPKSERCGRRKAGHRAGVRRLSRHDWRRIEQRGR